MKLQFATNQGYQKLATNAFGCIFEDK